MYYTHSLFLRVTNPALISETQIPEDTLVESNAATLGILGAAAHPPNRDSWTWGDLRACVRGLYDTAWMDELGRAIQAATQGRFIEPVQATFRAQNGEIYRPVLHRRDLDPDGSVGFCVLLIEKPEN